jgi:FtsP/CotA-like multicopper oxidase with cupredoxin domain
VAEGDALIVRVVNRGSYNVTVHWHGVRQMRAQAGAKNLDCLLHQRVVA